MLRFGSAFLLMLAVANRRNLLAIMGYVDAGSPHWIFAAFATTLFLAYIHLSNPGPFMRPIAHWPRIIRLPFAIIGIISGVSCLFLGFAGWSVRSPYFWGAGAVLLLICLLEVLESRKAKRLRKA